MAEVCLNNASYLVKNFFLIQDYCFSLVRFWKNDAQGQGRNQERANRAIAPPKFLQTWCHSRTSHEKLFLETALPLRELLKTTLSHTCCVILDKTINQSMYRCTMLPNTPSTEPETSCEALIVKWNQSRRQGGGVGGLIPPNKAPSPTN